MPASHLWRLDLPLLSNGDVIGRLSVAGTRDAEPIADKLLTLSKIIETAELGAEEATRAPATAAPAAASSASPLLQKGSRSARR